MSFTYDTTTDAGRVRLLITDTQDTGHIFEDAEISAFLAMDDDVRLAAAAALDVIASSTVLTIKALTLQDLKTDGPAMAKALREHAKALRDQVDAESSFDIAETVGNSFSERDRIYKQFLRGAI